MAAPMAKKKPRPKGRPKGRKETVSIQARVEPELAEALKRVAERNDRTSNQEMIRVLKKYLTEEGEWPPKPEAQDLPAD